MSEVYRARDTRLDRDVALKILPDAFRHRSVQMCGWAAARIRPRPSGGLVGLPGSANPWNGPARNAAQLR
jgi:hypothetical protein